MVLDVQTQFPLVNGTRKNGCKRNGTQRLSHGQGFAAWESGIAGCFELQCQTAEDARGSFVKPYQRSALAALGLEADFRESFYTVSGPRVLRGMHLQLPPADHGKLVYCVVGAVRDVALDLRMDVESFGRFEDFELDAERQTAVYLPSGVAHGFYVTRAPAMLMYHVTSEHVPELDRGIAWDSFGYDWPDVQPIVSDRDGALPELKNFDSPFRSAGRIRQ